MPFRDASGNILSPFDCNGTGQVVSMTGAHQESAAVATNYVVVLSTAVYCHVATGAAPVAANTHMAIPPNMWVPLHVGAGNKVSGLAASGSLIINELRN